MLQFTFDDFEFENRDDEEQLDESSYDNLRNAVVTSTDWTTETVLNQMERGNIQLSPQFQRRDAWDLKRKSRFIESLLLGLPIPQIVLAEQHGQRGRFVVLDGKQRLLSLLQFSGRGTGHNNAFSLRGLDARPDLHNLTYNQLQNIPEHNDDLDAFHNQTIRTVVIRNWPSNNFLYLVFIRLNTGSVQLSPQELRQALLPGPFVTFIDDKACESTTLQRLLRKDGPDFRMRDTELLLRHIAFKRFINRFNGSLKEFLDETCTILNESWETSLISNTPASVENDFLEFENAINFCFDLFGNNNVGKKWENETFQGQFNRALFDVQAYYFSFPEIRAAASNNKETILTKFKLLFANSNNFVASITSTTKSIDFTFTRFHEWAVMLKEVLGDCIEVPELIENRIVFQNQEED